MTIELVIPTPEATQAFGLDRFVSSKDANNNPFITVGNNKLEDNALTSNTRPFMNEVILEAFEYQPVKVTTKIENGVAKATLEYGGGELANNPPKLARIRILLTQKDISINHEHSYSDPTKGSTLANDLYNAIDNTTNTLAYYSAVTQSTNARAGNDQAFVAPVINRTDFQRTYNSSSYPSVDIEFTLLTNENFMRDVYVPIMILTSLTYPKRFTGEAAGSVGGDENSSATEAILQSLLNIFSNGVNTINNIVQPTALKVKEFLSITARQYSIKPPCLFNIYHQSGLYSYSTCNCTSMNVTYSGPWYNASAEELEVFNILNNGSINVDVSNRTFPSIAKVKMSFVTSERMVRDDFTNIVSNFSQIINSGKTTFSQFNNTQQEN